VRFSSLLIPLRWRKSAVEVVDRRLSDKLSEGQSPGKRESIDATRYVRVGSSGLHHQR
jgi:hypothetical protein